ncbi:MAG: DUF4168 domain-containing protein [Gemmatimonadetes bacterium]|nr:DUF4168 domain-containing protein [Gemmatimonadota bacterium]NIR79214.1 DUF4168 domain-containing protein [Gemmatimonadota bacterium]NIT87875.1 DUF4168 domain-containing protein [Gemmatimonadota bacterium]NIU31730.1 DUF4168 domain-containing protein [Gemmatimonadota bacterium]NIU36347.1 DUF4168 domain-containing protein [Gemmatimonadota bacterium]
MEDRSRAVARLAAGALAGLLLVSAPGAPLQAQGRADSLVSEETLTAFARAYPRIVEAREEFRARLGRTHDAERAAEIRREFNEERARILEEHGLTSEEFRRATFAVSTDARRRSAFEAMLRGAAEAPGEAVAEAPDRGAEPEGPAGEPDPADEGRTGEVSPPPTDTETEATDAGADDGLPPSVTEEMIEVGRAVFTGQGACFSCHGPDGTGTPIGPDLTDARWLHIDGSYEAIVTLVNSGVPEPEEHPAPMLPRGGTGIDDEQVRAVAAYVWTLTHPH